MRFTLLGSGAVRNNPRRAGPSQIVHVGEQRLLFDCGRGACLRLAQEDEKVEEIDRLFLTHLHFDHIVDVPYFVFVGWNNSRQNQHQQQQHQLKHQLSMFLMLTYHHQ